VLLSCRTGEFYSDEPIGDVVRSLHDDVDHTELARAAAAEVRRLR